MNLITEHYWTLLDFMDKLAQCERRQATVAHPPV